MSNEPKKKPPYYNYVRYTSMAFQMIGIILLAVFVGIKIDKALSTEKSWFTMLFSVIGVTLAVYFAIKDLIRK